MGDGVICNFETRDRKFDWTKIQIRLIIQIETDGGKLVREIFCRVIHITISNQPPHAAGSVMDEEFEDVDSLNHPSVLPRKRTMTAIYRYVRIGGVKLHGAGKSPRMNLAVKTRTPNVFFFLVFFFQKTKKKHKSFKHLQNGDCRN